MKPLHVKIEELATGRYRTTFFCGTDVRDIVDSADIPIVQIVLWLRANEK